MTVLFKVFFKNFVPFFPRLAKTAKKRTEKSLNKGVKFFFLK
jgi:hypothetical protein